MLAGKEQRGLLEGRILLPDGQTFTVYVTHLDHTSETARMVQLRIARTWLVRDRNRPHLVMGDFNAVSRWEWPDEARRTARSTGAPGRQSGWRRQRPAGRRRHGKAGYVDLYRTLGEPERSPSPPTTGGFASTTSLPPRHWRRR